MRQSSKAPTWKLYSVSLGSLHALARAVREALAKRRLYLESKHFHSWVCGGGSATWHTQRVLCEFDTTLNPTVTSGMVGDLRSPPPHKYFGANFMSIPGSTTILPTPWILFHVLISPLSPCPSRTMSNTVHDLAICSLSLSTRGRELLWLKPWAHDQFSSEGIPDPGASQPHAMASAVSRDGCNLK